MIRHSALMAVIGLALALPVAAEAPRGDVDPAPPRHHDGIAIDGDDGLSYTEETVPIRLRARGLLAVDYREYDSRNVRNSGLRLDRALVGVDGDALETVSFRVLADLRGTDTRNGFEEAWVSAEAIPWRLRFTGGLVPVPLGIEHSFPEATLPFVDYAFPAFVSGRTDVGVTVDGEFADGWLSYALTTSAGEGFDPNGNRRGDPQIAGRFVAYPFRPIDASFDVGGAEIPLVSGFFVSAAGSSSWDFSGPIDYPTSLRNKVVTTSRIDADRTWAFHLGYGFDLGPIRIVHEFTRQSLLGVELPDGTSRDFDRQNASWAASIAWRITGEPYDSRPYRQRDHPPAFPARPLYRDGQWGPGMIEIAARYANVEIDRDLIDLGYTTSAIEGRPTGISAQESRTFDIAVNWHPYTPLRFTFQLTRTLADQRPAVFDSHGRDTSFLFRVQISY